MPSFACRANLKAKPPIEDGDSGKTLPEPGLNIESPALADKSQEMTTDLTNLESPRLFESVRHSQQAGFVEVVGEDLHAHGKARFVGVLPQGTLIPGMPAKLAVTV